MLFQSAVDRHVWPAPKVHLAFMAGSLDKDCSYIACSKAEIIINDRHIVPKLRAQPVKDIPQNKSPQGWSFYNDGQKLLTHYPLRQWKADFVLVSQ